MPTPPLPDEEKRRTIAALKAAGGNVTHAAYALGISPIAMGSRKRSMLADPKWRDQVPPIPSQATKPHAPIDIPIADKLEDHRLRATVANLQRERKELLSRIDEIGRERDVALEIGGLVPSPRIKPRLLTGKRQAIPVAVGSDWHVEEDVVPARVNGLNRYNLEIATARARRFFEGIRWKLEHHAHGYRIDEMVLAVLGDTFSGYIHDELVETNNLSPVQACEFVLELLVDGIKFLLDTSRSLRIHVVCVPGNHGRTTQKIRIKTRVETSYEWGIYRQLARVFRDEKRLAFTIADGSHVYVKAWDWTIRATHGDDVRYQGGVGGVIVPLRKKLNEWNRAKHADVTILGHFHQFGDYGDAVINGSLIGATEYSVANGFAFQHPQQAFFLMDRTRGKVEVSPIWVDDSGKKGA